MTPKGSSSSRPNSKSKTKKISETTLLEKKILIIEDDDASRKFLSLRLQKLGFEVSSAGDGEKGLEKAIRDTPDLIILDLIMPKMPGEEVCKAIKESYDEKTASTPIIMVTGKDTTVDRIVGKVIGANAYLTKPFDFSDLFETIKQLLLHQK